MLQNLVLLPDLEPLVAELAIAFALGLVVLIPTTILAAVADAALRRVRGNSAAAAAHWTAPPGRP